MSEAIPLFVVHLLGFAGFLWLGLYALTHGMRRSAATLTGTTALVTACFFLEGSLLEALHGAAATPAVSRALWWADVVPIALWLHLSLRLNPQAAQARWRTPVLGATYSGAALLILAGTATDLVNDYRHSPVAAGPAYALYTAYLLLCTGFAVVNFASMSRTTGQALGPAGLPPLPAAGGADAAPRPGPVGPSRDVRHTERGLLVIGALCFLLGAGYLTLKILLRFSWYELPAYLLLLAGLGAVGATVAVHSVLLLGKDVRRDVVYSFTGLAGLLVVYLVGAGLLVGFNDTAHGLFALLLTALITAGHTLHDTARDGLDQVFFTPAVRQERAAARAYAAALAAPPAGPHPDLATAKAFDDAVRRALTHLSDPTKLATTPLLNLTVVARGVAAQHLEDNRLHRAAVLKEILLELLDGLRPQDEAGRVTGEAWRYYNCLYYPYVRGISRRRAPTVLRQLAERRRREGTPRSDLEQIVAWLLDVDEDTFYKWQRRGSDTIAAALREREATAGGMVPTPSDAPEAPVAGLSSPVPRPGAM